MDAVLPENASQARFLNSKQTRALLGNIHRNTLKRWMSQKKDPIPHIRINARRYLFPLDKILWWLDKHSS